MKKNFKQHITSLESGLSQIQKTIRNPKNIRAYEKAKIAREIQIARIQSFREGYSIRDNEITGQQTLEEDP